MARRGLLFDLDGTLSLTDHLHHAAYRRVLPGLGHREDDLDEAWFRRTVAGRANRDIWRGLMPAGTPDEELEAMVARKEEAARAARMVRQGGCGVLRRHERPAEHRSAAAGLPGPGGALQHREGRMRPGVRAHEAAPSPVLAGLELLQVEPHASMAFEDSPSGVRAAVGAGIATVGILSTASKEALEGAGAFLTVPDFAGEALGAALAGKLAMTRSL
eukprot:CAMPEP_0179232574 /NCGR_PEP_ID=MMETSP0797-20121207/11930_1 /TAXON_ID=47934 /ORGANISM="Dinophysis acuminata, Strain DAEP01" /LENGTH=216 /DNA_ID=CAMNT_0020939699 /DNA_START=57 /DNA_END=708 /DNA_ORIENTATION=-